MENLEKIKVRVNDEVVDFYITKKEKDKLLELINENRNMMLIWICDIDLHKEMWSLLKTDKDDIRFTVDKYIKRYNFLVDKKIDSIKIPELNDNL